MKKVLEIIPKIVLYKLFRSCNIPKMLPLNLTVSITYKCNSRCRTCNVWTKNTSEFSAEEFNKTFESIGKAPYWLTISGGEPFLRDDVVEICCSAYNHFKPGIINIPTNGMYNRIPEKVEQMLDNCPDTHIIVNLSMDGIGEKHDYIRNVKGFNKALRTYEALRELDHPNLSIGIHTVISRYNVNDIPSIYDYFQKKNPDSYITEIAEERVELGNIGTNITPSLKEYTKAIDFIIQAMKNKRYSGISRITQAFRLEYYDHVKKILGKKPQIPCYAGFASSHIAPDGDVWACCIKALPMGNLREVNYDFRKVWLSRNAYEQRRSIKRRCFCPLANAYYTNMLCDTRTLLRVAGRVFFTYVSI